MDSRSNNSRHATVKDSQIACLFRRRTMIPSYRPTARAFAKPPTGLLMLWWSDASAIRRGFRSSISIPCFPGPAQAANSFRWPRSPGPDGSAHLKFPAMPFATPSGSAVTRRPKKWPARRAASPMPANPPRTVGESCRRIGREIFPVSRHALMRTDGPSVSTEGKERQGYASPTMVAQYLALNSALMPVQCFSFPKARMKTAMSRSQTGARNLRSTSNRRNTPTLRPRWAWSPQ